MFVYGTVVGTILSVVYRGVSTIPALAALLTHKVVVTVVGMELLSLGASAAGAAGMARFLMCRIVSTDRPSQRPSPPPYRHQQPSLPPSGTVTLRRDTATGTIRRKISLTGTERTALHHQ